MDKICKKCLLRDMAGKDKEMIDKYKAAIKNADKVASDIYEQRLSVCKNCDLLNEGTCNACGCYVELRALTTISKCPHNRW